MLALITMKLNLNVSQEDTGVMFVDANLDALRQNQQS